MRKEENEQNNTDAININTNTKQHNIKENSGLSAITDDNFLVMNQTSLNPF